MKGRESREGRLTCEWSVIDGDVTTIEQLA
jgi:hypothetical protein